MGIPFTQYTLPNGAKKDVTIERSTEIEAKAQAIIDAGYHFECEMLRTGEVALTIGDTDKWRYIIEELALEIRDMTTLFLEAWKKNK